MKAIYSQDDIKSYYGEARYLKFSEIDSSVGMVFYIKDERQFSSFVTKFKAACRTHESFLGIELDAPKDLSGFESVGEDEDFETVGNK